jgi:GT2 family glycosyltransferase
MGLSWGLAIATRNRADMLCRCVEAALRQSRPPVEVVICDASADWVASRNRVEAMIRQVAPDTRLWYGPSPKAQQTVQRNIAIEHSTADVLFMIDDDSLLRRDAAERVMRVYEADDRVVAVGVGAMRREEDLASADDSAEMFRHNRSIFRRVGAQVFGRFFFARPVKVQHPVARAGGELKDTIYVEGCQLTVRRDIAARSRFDEALVSGHFEDLDASIRFSRLGGVVMLNRPLLFHAAAARSSEIERRRGTLARFGWILNIACLNRKYFGGGSCVRLFCWTHWLRCLLVDLLVAPFRRDLSRLRGCIHALPPMMELTFASQSRIAGVVVERTEALKARLGSAKPTSERPSDLKLAA